MKTPDQTVAKKPRRNVTEAEKATEAVRIQANKLDKAAKQVADARQALAAGIKEQEALSSRLTYLLDNPDLPAEVRKKYVGEGSSASE